MKIEGSLKEIGAKPGDVVVLTYNGILGNRFKNNGIGLAGVVLINEHGELYTEGKSMNRGDNMGHTFRIISKSQGISDDEIL